MSVPRRNSLAVVEACRRSAFRRRRESALDGAENEVLDRFVGLSLKEEERHLDPETYENDAALRVGARLSDNHRERALDGCQSHSLVSFWRWTNPDASIKSVDILWGREDRGDEEHSLTWFQKKILKKGKKNGAGKRCLRKGYARLLCDDAAAALTTYLLSTDAAKPWYGVRDVTRRPFEMYPEDLYCGDVLQGDLGDCYFACALSLVAQHYPSCLRARVRRIDETNEFIVRFWSQRHGSCNSPSKTMRMGPISVRVNGHVYVHNRCNRKGAKETPLYARSRSQAWYPAILEKAWLMLRCGILGTGRRKKKRNAIEDVTRLPSYEDIANDNGFDAGDVIHVLTGLETMTVTVMDDGESASSMTPSELSETKERVWNIVVDALREGRAVSSGTYQVGTGHGKMRVETWRKEELLSHHNYCVLDAGRDTSLGRFLVLRNPQGQNQSPFILSSTPAMFGKDVDGETGERDGDQLAKDGCFRLTLTEFVTYFSTVSYVSEICDRYPPVRCHRYRKNIASPERVSWCCKEDAPSGEEKTEGDDDDDPRRRHPKRALF